MRPVTKFIKMIYHNRSLPKYVVMQRILYDAYFTNFMKKLFDNVISIWTCAACIADDKNLYQNRFPTKFVVF